MKIRMGLLLLLITGARKAKGNIVEDDIYYQNEEIDKLMFSLDHRVRDKSKKEEVKYVNGENAYGYTNKGITKVFNVYAEKEIKNFFRMSKDPSTCDHNISLGTVENRVIDQICYKREFCGIIAPEEYVKVDTTLDWYMRKNEKKDSLTYCAYLNDTHILIYHVGTPQLLKPNVIYEDIFFKENEKGIITCHAMKINLRYISIHTFDKKCLQDVFEEHVRAKCNERKTCEIDFKNIKTGKKKCVLGKDFIVHIKYECIDGCNQEENKVCDIYNGEGRLTTCRYGYNMIPIINKFCEKNYTCNNNVCSVNEFCSSSSESCVCKTSLVRPEITNNCFYTNVCDVMKCPLKSKCTIYENSKKAECKCEDDKYLYKDKCYDNSELEQVIKMETTRRDKYYMKDLFTGIALKPEYIFMKCDDGYTIQVVNATSSCYPVIFEKNKIRYITDRLKEACNGKVRCAFANRKNPVLPLDESKMCGEKNVIYEYEYICAQQNNKNIQTNANLSGGKTITLFKSEHINNASKEGIGKIAIFRSRFNSKIECNGGSIIVNKALVKTGNGCDDLDLTTSVKSYCDNLSNCDIGLTHHFDTYCKSDQYLYVHYTCEDLCEMCGPNSSCYGNKHKYKCFCDNPYIAKDNHAICEAPSNCNDITCGENQICKMIDNKPVCQCGTNFKDVNGLCVVDDKCDLSCPSNKFCVIEKVNNKNKKMCKCVNGLSFENGICVCSAENQIEEEGNLCIPKNKCKRKEYLNICTNDKEQCVYDNNTDIVRCDCIDHYKRDERGICVPINYCENITCNENEICKVIDNKGVCECKENLKKNNNNECVFDNLCVVNRGNCPPDSECIYHEKKKHECVCHKKELVPVNGKCVMPDRCTNGQNKCSENSICVNRLNKEPLCVCMFNYIKTKVNNHEGSTEICVLENPCLVNNGGCPINSICTYEKKKVSCSCGENYEYKALTNKTEKRIGGDKRVGMGKGQLGHHNNGFHPADETDEMDDNVCHPKTSEMIRTFSFEHNDDSIIALGTCGIVQFVYKNNQVIWKINKTDEFYIFNYEYPNEGKLQAQVANRGDKSILYLKKKYWGKSIYNDFELVHNNCVYENMFFYTHREDV
ncbi:Rh5 interacting protein [Plasmodium gonderi]|uniref:Rh5 interacting protein n=1 Tax=Plasmodium gonderi TaxID=77519 RepID=A0A1Y1JEA0_PLAGO|nr:Rh5 interacting protein [Plasmodium gonderi]GAW80590.1 Rh5 interacting protein [Plasmodium gonderi]